MPDYEEALGGLEIEGLDPEKFKAQYPTLESTVKTVLGAQKKIAELSDGVAGTVKVPDWESATDEQRTEFFQKIGRPEDVEGYGTVEGLDDDALARLSGASFKAGLTPAQHREMAEALKSATQGQAEEIQAYFQEKSAEQEAERKIKYAGQYEEKMALIERTRDEIFRQRPDLGETMKKMALDNHSALDDLLLFVSDTVGDDRLAKHFDTQKEMADLPTEETLDKEIETLLNNPEFSHDKKGTPEYQKLEAQYTLACKKLATVQKRGQPVRY